jgi:hypothetical protein
LGHLEAPIAYRRKRKTCLFPRNQKEQKKSVTSPSAASRHLYDFHDPEQEKLREPALGGIDEHLSLAFPADEKEDAESLRIRPTYHEAPFPQATNIIEKEYTVR